MTFNREMVTLLRLSGCPSSRYGKTRHAGFSLNHLRGAVQARGRASGVPQGRATSSCAPGSQAAIEGAALRTRGRETLAFWKTPFLVNSSPLANNGRASGAACPRSLGQTGLKALPRAAPREAHALASAPGLWLGAGEGVVASTLPRRLEPRSCLNQLGIRLVAAAGPQPGFLSVEAQKRTWVLHLSNPSATRPTWPSPRLLT